jgi:glycine/serine hydroxymethyltransferase
MGRAAPQTYVERLDGILRDHRSFREQIVPLCAAETPISDFVRSFMADAVHEKYAMGGILSPAADNFIGARYVLDLHRLAVDLCREAFGARYADPRPLSGTGAVTNLLMTLSQPGQKILLQTSASGGHSSMWPICRRLGLEIVDMPYDFDRFQVDADMQGKLDLAEIDFVLYAPSDILYPPDLRSIGFSERTTVVYDATQTLGLIASGHLPSPLNEHSRVVVSAGTHKTLPGPSCGLLITQNDEIASRLDAELSPKFVRHSHPHHVAALCATLIEHLETGTWYSNRIQAHVETLTRSLSAEGLTVLQADDRASETHQVFVHVPAGKIDHAYARSREAGVTLNVKRKPLFRETGVRLGVQEIARYQWEQEDVEKLATLLRELLVEDSPVAQLRPQVQELARHNRFLPEACVNP